MKNSFTLLWALMLLMLVSACSKPGGTKAGVKLNVAGISALSATAGSGGTLLFGRSANGDLFGKIINGTEDTLNVPNGDWTFYALMWDTNATALPMNDKVFCSKVSAKLSGTDTSLTFNLTNSNCSDSEFSNGRYSTSSGLLRFADVFLEECDDINATTNWYCGQGNQGSALSYRLKFQNFMKSPSSPFAFGAEAITSACKKIDNADPADVMKQGLPVNFPSGNGVAPFVVSIEFFVGSATCDTTDPKGVHTVLLGNGLGAPAGGPNKVLTSTTNCTFSTPDWPAIMGEKQNLCEAFYGSWTGSSCSSVPLSITRFAPTCGSQVSGQAPAIKHLIALPKAFICDRYINSNSIIGAHPFAGGNGSLERPYKICTEWQINQIGEKTSPANYTTSSYKLLNDLDMNKTDIIGPYAKPQCTGVMNSIVDKHHNFNPLDRLTSDCLTFDTTTGFQGTFNGNGRVIKNVRIQTKNANQLGFVRRLTGNGRIRNLFIKNAEVRGLNNVGGIAGVVDGTANEIANVNVEELKLEARGNTNADGNYAGGIAGRVTVTSAVLSNVHVSEGEVRGRDLLGGIIGENAGQILRSHFRGHLSTDQSNGNTAGGLVGSNLSGSIIKNSYSEGIINSGTIYTGGLAGTNMGNISNSYSTMAMDIYNGMGNSYLGGLVGDNTSGTISDVFFDGALSSSSGGGTPTLNGTNAVGSGGTNCYSTVGPATSPCVVKTPISLRTTLMTFTIPADWAFTSKSIPRLFWETRECLNSDNQLSVSAQVTTLGRGGTSPVVICNSDQLSELSGRPSTENYRIADDINLSMWSSPASTVSSFNGQLFGNFKILYGLNLTYVVGDNNAGYEGIFRSVSSSGMIGNLKVYHSTISNTAGLGDIGTGLLAGENLGTIANIEISNSNVSAEHNVGLVVGHNKNLVKRVLVERGSVSGYTSAGGLVGLNASSANIIKSRSNVKVTNSMGPDFESFGGIAGTNNGSIDQVRYDGDMIFTSPTTSPNGMRVGGIAGYNSGAITNALVDNRSRIQVADANGVGGVAGENYGSGSSINYSLALGKVIFNNTNTTASPGLNFHSLVGFNNGGNIGTYVYYLENKIGSLLGQASTASACTSGTTCNVSPLINSTSDLFDFSFGGGGGNLSTLVPLSGATSSSFSYPTGPALAASTQLDFFKAYQLGADPYRKTLSEVSTLLTYCPGSFTSSTGTGVCSGGFNIAEMGGVGNDRIIDYYIALMYNQAPAANAPIWEFSTDEGPRLIQIED